MYLHLKLFSMKTYRVIIVKCTLRSRSYTSCQLWDCMQRTKRQTNQANKANSEMKMLSLLVLRICKYTLISSNRVIPGCVKCCYPRTINGGFISSHVKNPCTYTHAYVHVLLYLGMVGYWSFLPYVSKPIYWHLSNHVITRLPQCQWNHREAYGYSSS